MNKDHPETPQALRSLCASASEKAQSWQSGPAVSWTQARAAALAASRRQRLVKLGLVVGLGVLALAGVAAQFGGEPAPAGAAATVPAAADARLAQSPVPAVAETPLAVVNEIVAPAALRSDDARTAPGTTPAMPEEGKAAPSDESVSQPDGSC